MKSEPSQFSENFWYEKENENIRVITNDEEDVCTIILEFDEDNLIMRYDIIKFNGKFTQIPLVWEIVKSLVDSALINSCVSLEIKSIPMNLKYFTYLINEVYIKAFGDRFKISKIDRNPLLNVEFEIIQQRNTHYIQQAYLRNFSSNKSEWEKSGDKDKARIFMFNKKAGALESIGNTTIEKKFGPKISSIAKEEYFHSLLFELTIANTLEKNTPPILDKIIKNKTIKTLSNREKEDLIRYVIFTWQRPKEARLHTKEVMEKAFLLEARGSFKKELPANVKVEYNELSLKVHHEKSILNFIASNSPHNLVEHFTGFDFRLLKARQPDFFLTSDNPVIRNNAYYLREKKGGNDFIKKRIEMIKKHISKGSNQFGFIETTSEHPERAPRVKGVEFYMPISPRLCICFYDRQNGIKPLSVHSINKETVLQSNQFIYSYTDKIGFINQIIKNNPDCIEKSGKRSIIIDNVKEIPKELHDNIRYKNLSKETYKKFLGYDGKI